MTASAVDTVVVGAGQAGLAVSRLLVAARREHVVLERADVGQRWTSQRWDSLRLLTPNWLTRLPGWTYQGSDPDGFMPARERAAALPCLRGLLRCTGAHRRRRASGRACRFRIRGADGPRRLDGPSRRPGVRITCQSHRAAGAGTSGRRHRADHRLPEPGPTPGRGVLVVGASASGVQIAHELAATGRSVVLAVGRHTRMPRSYRGMDVFWWLARTGRLARTIDDMPDPGRARREPSLQLIGHDDEAADLDLATLHAAGVRLTGRLVEVTAHIAYFAGDLVPTVMQADIVMNRFLDAVDVHVDRAGLSREVAPLRRPRTLHAPGRSTPTRPFRRRDRYDRGRCRPAPRLQLAGRSGRG